MCQAGAKGSTVDTYKSLQKKFQKTVTILKKIFKSPIPTPGNLIFFGFYY